MNLTPEQQQKIAAALYENGHTTPSDVRIEDETILMYKSHEDRRDSMLGAWNHLEKILAVDFDGDPTTIEIGPRGLFPDVEVVVKLRPGQIFK